MKARFAALCLASLFASVPAAAEGIALKGDKVQGGLLIGEAPDGAYVTLDGKPLPVSERGYFVFGFDRDATGTSTLKLNLPDGETLAETIEIGERDYDIQRIEGVPQKYVSPPPEVFKKIQADGVKKRKARAADETLLDHFADGFIWPVTGPISGVYGSQRFYNGEPRRPHYGLDIAAPTGTPVVAPQAGIIRLAEPDMYFEGGLIFLDHGQGLVSILMHLSSVDVETGQKVKQGDLVGRVGATGRVTGAHLDWRMQWRDAYIDPALLLGPQPE